ncbi:MAG: ParB family transcriptional regulator, chromosome partitioning protein [Frankiales bacterium]|jgi:ParB family chromosome partitioning protein|nr:ParB family transcriptional regulator, chromosome partitioning protein [Frankiales bacterium]
MSTRRGGLGRGLGALIPTSAPASVADLSVHADSRQAAADTGPLPVAGARYAELDVASIAPNPQQPRTVFDEEALDELARSVREVGVLQPVVVREINPGQYQLIMGERRWRASQAAGVATVPAIIRDTADTDLLRDALLENLHRQQLNPLEEGAAYQQLLEEFDGTQEELASRLGKSRSHVSNTMRLLNLPPTVQRRLAAGVLSAGHARALLSLEDADAQERLATRIVAEGLSVRAVEELVTLNETGAPPKTSRRHVRPHAPALASLASRLSDHFETRVKVELGRSKGKITLEFASVDDLERIVAAMAPAAATALDETPVG